MISKQDIGKFLITYDPEKPQTKFTDLELALSPLAKLPAPLMAKPVDWPAAKTPTPQPLNPAPAESDDLTRFAGYDVVVVTWTSAEAASLAALFTPGYKLGDWYEYRHNVQNYIDVVVGSKSPFLSTDPDDARYYHSMGLYFPCTIGTTKVLLFKSGLHFCYDGPAFPVKTLMKEIYQAVQPKVFITTGTGGAIGKNVLLGDVVIAPQITFDCTTPAYVNEQFNKAKYNTSPLPANFRTAMPDDLLKVNGARVTDGVPVPNIWTDNASLIVTTDTYEYDDVQNSNNLQGLGRACDMGDAMVALALQGIPGLQFYAIRNASDPQMAVPDAQQNDPTQTSFGIYHYWGGVTTAASVIATWKLITTIYP